PAQRAADGIAEGRLHRAEGSGGGICSGGLHRAGGSAYGPHMTPAKTTSPKPVPFDWAELHQFKAEKRFLDGYPPDTRTFFSPRDDVHGVLTSLIASAQHAIVINMYGYDDDDID